MPQSLPGNELTLFSPNRTWAVCMSPPGVRFSGTKQSPDGSRVWAFGRDHRYDLRITVMIEEATGGIDSDESCRSHYWATISGGRLPKTSVRFRTEKGRAISEYISLGFLDDRPSRRHVHAYEYRDGTCIAIHVSQGPHKPTNRFLFDRVFRTVVWEGPEPVPSGPAPPF